MNSMKEHKWYCMYVFSNNPMTKIPNAKKKMMMMMKQKLPNLFAIKLEEYRQDRWQTTKGFWYDQHASYKQYNFDIEDSVSHRHQDRV